MKTKFKAKCTCGEEWTMSIEDLHDWGYFMCPNDQVLNSLPCADDDIRLLGREDEVREFYEEKHNVFIDINPAMYLYGKVEELKKYCLPKMKFVREVIGDIDGDEKFAEAQKVIEDFINEMEND